MPDESKPDSDAHEESRQDAEKITSAPSNLERPEEQEASVETAAPQQPHDPANTGSPEKEESELIVVGIGASAGGLEAVGELLRHPAAGGMAYIVVQHLAPDHESMLTALLARSSQMQVVTAVEGMRVEPNYVYIIPPNAVLTIRQGALRLTTLSSGRSSHSAVDYLFRSLAQDQGHRAIGIVMSGTGTDGTAGLRAIKTAGGFTFVQDPSTAKYDGMPRSALESGAADFCLPPKELAEELARIAKRPRVPPGPQDPELAPEVQNQRAQLFALIRSAFGNDLTHYKLSTIDRRIERRMMLRKLEHLEDYVRVVQQDRDELRALYKDLLITVTSFFRDPEAFEALQTKVFSDLLAQKKPSQPIRVWVPACATGEEAYSFAICLLEFCEEKGRDEKIQIFGTDLDEDSIQHARRGLYAATIALDVSPERLNRFFVKKDDGFQVGRRIREMVVFSQQNILRDPPFSRLDLVSCRNLLIYLQPSAQKKVLQLLHFALNPSGYLFLGTSETVADATDLFSPVDRKNRIYVRKLAASQAAHELGSSSPLSHELPHGPPARPTLTLQGLADRKVLELYGPAGVIVSENFDILYFRGRTVPYLDPSPGAASLNLLKVARVELHFELRRTLHQARAEQLRVTTDLTYREDGKHCLIRIDVVPLHDPDTRARCFLVLFHKLPSPKEIPVLSPEQGKTDEALFPLAQRNEELERELAKATEYLQTILEDKESMLEELKSANEELQSSNEELQSTNEELETSREEMQSTNEELTTVNDELQNRMAEISQTNDDLYNVLAGVNHAVVIVGMDLRIRRYTRAAEQLFNLVSGDIGRSIGMLDAFLAAGRLEAKVTAVIQSLSTLEEEVLASNRRWYALKVSPYKSLDHAIRGALVTLVDIDVQKRALDMTHDVGNYAAKFLGAVGHPLLILDRDQRIVWANDPFLSTFELSSEETVGSALASLDAGQFAEPGLRQRLEGVFASDSILRGYALRLQSGEGGERTMTVGASMVPISTEVPLALISIEPQFEIASRERP